MPGHVVLLAASYALFGFGVLSSLLPSLLAYVVATAGVFLLGNRLYGVRAGALAAVLFAFFPANLVYSFIAMADVTFVAAGVLAMTAFVHLPRRWLPLGPPLLLVLPFLFRETGAFLVLPMALCVLRVRGLVPAVFASAASVVSLWAVNRWQTASGKLQASLAWVTEGGFNYGDAFAPPPRELTGSEWVEALLANAGLNLGYLREQFGTWPGELVPLALVAFALLMLGTSAVALGRLHRDPFALGAAGLMVFLTLLALFAYDAKTHKLVRTIMVTVPLGCVALVGGAPGVPRTTGARSLGRSFSGLMVVASAALGLWVSQLTAQQLTLRDDARRANTQALAQLHGSGLIVAGNIASPLAVEGYPEVTWCLATDNEETLARLLRAHDVRTIVLFEELSPEFLAEHGWRKVHRQKIGLRWHVFYKPAR